MTMTGNTKRASRKQDYYITDDATGSLIAVTLQYTDDLATMWAIRTLKALKDANKAPQHATLWQPRGRQARKVQGYRRAG